VLALLILPFGRSATAQGKSHAYVSVGRGATDLNTGLDWLIANGRIGAGGDVGLGELFLFSINGSYHPLRIGTGRRLDPFATLGFMLLGSSERSLKGASVGGGMTFRFARSLGVRVDAFRFLTASSHYDVPPQRRSEVHLWGARAGLAFGFS
jgi:hypothetical protein